MFQRDPPENVPTRTRTPIKRIQFSKSLDQISASSGTETDADQKNENTNEYQDPAPQNSTPAEYQVD
jgi:hypothetical protein